MNNDQESAMIERLSGWGEGQPLVRAMLLTSSRAIPGAPVDVFSDYDVILVLLDILPYHEDRTWLEAFGRVLALYRDPIESYLGFPKSTNVTQYEDGLKIDFTLWPVEILRKIVATSELPDELDAGYRILLDKDGLTVGLEPPTYRAYIPHKPSESEYQAAVEQFFLEAVYVAKFLRRDDLIAAKHVLDHYMKQESLLRMLEWRVEIDHAWALRPGLYGQRLKKWLRHDLWVAFEKTYTGAGLEANWRALFRSTTLFRKVASEVGEQLGYAYPGELDRHAIAYFYQIKKMVS